MREGREFSALGEGVFLFRQAEGSLFGRKGRAKWELIFEKKKRAPKAKRGKALLGAIWRAFSVSSFLCFFSLFVVVHIDFKGCIPVVIVIFHFFHEMENC